MLCSSFRDFLTNGQRQKQNLEEERKIPEQQYSLTYRTCLILIAFDKNTYRINTKVHY